MDSYTITIAASVVLFIAVGNYAGRRVHSVEDYFVAGRRAPTLLILGTLMASVFSTSLFLGEAGFTVATVLFVGKLVGGFGGVEAAVEALASQGSKPDTGSWHGTIGEGAPWPRAVDFLIWFVIIDLCWSVVYAVSPWQASRHLMARDEHVVLRASIYACFAVIFMQYLIYGAGGLVNLARTDIAPSETVLLWAARHLVPGLLGALLLAGIVAAALSSASTFLSLVGFSVSNDLGVQDRAPRLGATRLCMGGVALVVLALSLTVPANVFWIMLFIGTVFASSWGPVAFMSVWSSRITADGAFWGLIAGFAGNVIPAGLDYAGVIHLPSYFNPALLGAALGLAVIYLVSLRSEPSPNEQAFRRRLHETPAGDRSRRKTRVTLLAPGLLVAYGILMPALLLNWYVLAYQRGSGVVPPGAASTGAGPSHGLPLGPLFCSFHLACSRRW